MCSFTMHPTRVHSKYSKYHTHQVYILLAMRSHFTPWQMHYMCTYMAPCGMQIPGTDCTWLTLHQKPIVLLLSCSFASLLSLMPFCLPVCLHDCSLACLFMFLPASRRTSTTSASPAARAGHGWHPSMRGREATDDGTAASARNATTATAEGPPRH